MLLDDHIVEQADAEMACIQALLEGPETWVMLPEEAWPKEWYHADGSNVYDRPAVRMLRVLYGHPDSGTFWEKHADEKLRSVGFVPIETWPSCYFHRGLKLFCLFMWITLNMIPKPVVNTISRG